MHFETPSRPQTCGTPVTPSAFANETTSDSPLHRFSRSMLAERRSSYDTAGYDLQALRAASDAERLVIEALLLRRDNRDWRDFEALVALDTPQARAAVSAALVLTSAKHLDLDDVARA